MNDEMNSITIDVGADFSRAPAGRDESDGPYSGQAFREKFLEPNIDTKKMTIILLDGVEGYGSSFLEEAFGGLVRSKYLSFESFNKNIKLVSSDDFLIEEINSYIKDASGFKHV